MTESDPEELLDILFNGLTLWHLRKRKNRLCYNYRQAGVSKEHLAAHLGCAVGTVDNIFRRGRVDIQNKKLPWKFIPGSVCRYLEKHEVRYQPKLEFNDLLRNLDSHPLTNHVKDAVRLAALMPSIIQQEIISDKQTAEQIVDEVPDFLESLASCRICKRPFVPEDHASSSFAKDCCEECNIMAAEQAEDMRLEMRFATYGM